jgi:hypothetical protein
VLDQFSTKNIDLYVDFHRIMCGLAKAIKCTVLTPNAYPMSFNGYHLTSEGGMSIKK